MPRTAGSNSRLQARLPGPVHQRFAPRPRPAVCSSAITSSGKLAGDWAANSRAWSLVEVSVGWCSTRAKRPEASSDSRLKSWKDTGEMQKSERGRRKEDFGRVSREQARGKRRRKTIVEARGPDVCRRNLRDRYNPAAARQTQAAPDPLTIN